MRWGCSRLWAPRLRRSRPADPAGDDVLHVQPRSMARPRSRPRRRCCHRPAAAAPACRGARPRAGVRRHRLALYLLLLAGLSALAAAAFGFAERRVTLPRTVPLAFAGALALVVVAGSIAVFARYGGPHTIAQKGWDSFSATPPQDQADLRERLFTFTGSYRVDLWRVALDDYADHPVVGSGSGSYEHYWNEHRPFAHQVRDAHSLYLEVLAELGPIGLALLAI